MSNRVQALGGSGSTAWGRGCSRTMSKENGNRYSIEGFEFET